MDRILPEQNAFSAAGLVLSRYNDSLREVLQAQAAQVVNIAYTTAEQEIAGIRANLASDRSLVTEQEQYEQLGQQLLLTGFDAVQARSLAKVFAEKLRPSALHHRLFLLAIIEKLRQPTLSVDRAILLARYTLDKLEDDEGAFADASPLVKLLYQLHLFLSSRIPHAELSWHLAVELANHPQAKVDRQQGYDTAVRSL